jgi:glutamate synthase domain-containing protein 3
MSDTNPGKTQNLKIDCQGLYYRDLNLMMKNAVQKGVQKIELHNVYGQRYIGTNLTAEVEIDIFGTPGNDLGAFMNGPRITVHGNAQDGCGNTMNEGTIIVHGSAGDIVGLSARGGNIFIKENAGYRAGIHMKEYSEKKPAIIIGGTAQDFLGEYMAGGMLILLGLNLNEYENYPANFIGTGMHGGVIYLRGSVEEHQLGKEVGITELDDNDLAVLKKWVSEYAYYFDCNTENILKNKFIKLIPRNLRPYGTLYAY